MDESENTHSSIGAAPAAATLSILERLIGFATVSRDSNLGLIEWVRDYLAHRGVRSRLTYDASGTKANLFATVGDRAGAGMILSGHTDVVPVDGQEWSSDPFCAVVRDGRMFGRGTADMKGFIAVALAAVDDLLAADDAEPVHLALSYDEEVGCKGVPGLLEDLRALSIQPRGCIVGEPSSMQVIVGHKGGSVYKCCVRGREAHAALAPQGVNAIEYAARLINQIQQVAGRLHDTEERHAGFDVPYSTLHTGVIHGGVAANIVPRECDFRVDIRTLPWTRASDLIEELDGYGREHLLPQMRAVAPESDISWQRLGEVPSFAIDKTAELTRYALALAGGEPGYVNFGSEAGLFQRAGIPAVICGPGSIVQAHRPDEFIELAQLAACERFVRRLVSLPYSPTVA